MQKGSKVQAANEVQTILDVGKLQFFLKICSTRRREGRDSFMFIKIMHFFFFLVLALEGMMVQYAFSCSREDVKKKGGKYYKNVCVLLEIDSASDKSLKS